MSSENQNNAFQNHNFESNKVPPESCLPTLHSTEEAWAIKTLPTNWEPVNQYSEKLEKYCTRRRVNDEHTKQTLMAKMESVNQDIALEIRFKSESLKDRLNQYSVRAQNVVAEFETEPNELLSYTREDFENSKNSITDLNKKSTQELSAFQRELEELETLRSDKLKSVLMEAYSEMLKTSCQLPYPIHEYFEKEILEVNQMILSNHRCYLDLYVQLNAQISESNRMLLTKLEWYCTKWKSAVKEETVRLFNVNKMKELETQAELCNAEQVKRLSDKHSAISDMCKKFSIVNLTKDEAAKWSTDMDKIVRELDECARKLLDLYKSALNNVSNGYFEDFQKLSEKMVEQGFVRLSETEEIKTEICEPVVQDMHRRCTVKSEDTEELWNSAIGELKEKLLRITNFIVQASHLWDNHFYRKSKSKNNIVKQLESLIIKHNKLAQVQKGKINKKEVELRQAGDQFSLNKTLKACTSILVGSTKKFHSQFDAEVKTVTKYIERMENESEILFKELLTFLDEFPRDMEVAPTQQRTRASQFELTPLTTRPSIPAQILICGHQVTAVNNWMFGLWECIERHAFACKEELGKEASGWLTEQLEQLKNRLEENISSNRLRQDSIRAVYEIRQSELELHDERLESHKAGVQVILSNLESRIKLSRESYDKIVTKYDNNFTDILAKAENVNNSSRIKRLLIEIDNAKTLILKHLDNLTQEYSEECEKRLKDILLSSRNFADNVKLFSQDGNFNVTEGKRTKADLRRLEKITRKKIARLRKLLKSTRMRVDLVLEKKHVQYREKLGYSMDEFLHNERVTVVIKGLKHKIKQHAVELKLMIGQAEKMCSLLESGTRNYCNNSCYVMEYESNLEELAGLLVKLSKYLVQKETVIIKSQLDVVPLQDQVEDRERANSARRDSIRSSRISKQLQINSVDYKSLLFDSRPVDDGSFMLKICSDLYNSLAYIEDVSKEFYSTHELIINTGKVQPDLESFMAEVLSKYKCYQLQTELVWLKETNKFLQIVQHLQQLADCYQQSLVQNMHTRALSVLSQTHVGFIKTMESLKKDDEDRMRSVRMRLRPLHGYPGNRDLLAALENEMASAMLKSKECSTDVMCMLDTYKNKQSDFIRDHNENLCNLHERLSRLHEKHLGEILTVPLFQQLMSKIEHLDENPDACYKIEITQSESSKIIELPSECAKGLQQNPVNLEVEKRVKYDDNHIIELSQELQEKFENYLEEVEEMKCGWNENVSSNEKLFATDVERVKKLYAVKYDKI